MSSTRATSRGDGWLSRDDFARTLGVSLNVFDRTYRRQFPPAAVRRDPSGRVVFCARPCLDAWYAHAPVAEEHKLARTRLAIAKAEAAELASQQRRGEVIERAEALAALQQLARLTRATLDRITAAALALMAEEARVEFEKTATRERLALAHDLEQLGNTPADTPLKTRRTVRRRRRSAAQKEVIHADT